MGMCVINTPLNYFPEFGLWVKREDLCCPGGPNFSKTRGVFAHVCKRTETVIGVLDTAHSQGGWAVARACSLLDKQCLLFYPIRKSEQALGLKPQQLAAKELGAALIHLPAGRSAVLYHQAKAQATLEQAYMMPNALKLMETVEETALEVGRTKLPRVNNVLVSTSSGTIAAGVALGLTRLNWQGNLIIHLGYSRPEKAVSSYIHKMGGSFFSCGLEFIDEHYAYVDKARPCLPSPCPMNEYYDLKLWSWWIREGRKEHGSALFWNIG